MSRSLRTLALGIALCALPSLAACEKTPEPGSANPPAKPATSAAPVAATAASVAVVQPELTDEDIPVPEDFIEEATKELDEKNYKAQIDAIEKEIDSPDD